MACHWGWVVYFFIFLHAKAGACRSAEVACEYEHGSGWGVFGRKKRWGGTCRDMHQVPSTYGGDAWLNVGGGWCIFLFFCTQRQGRIVLHASHGCWCRGVGGVCLVGKKGGGDL
jgi:hypothetical protein